MGFNKETELYWHGKGLRQPRQTNVCSDHINDQAIKKYIIEEGQVDTCSYCKKRTTILELEFLIHFINSGLKFFYDDAGNCMYYESAEGGYHGAPTFLIDDLLNDEIGLEINNSNLQNDIQNAFDSSIVWCKDDPYSERKNEELTYNWNHFKNIVKHNSRYFFLNTPEGKKAFEILNEVGRRVDSLNLFTNISIGTKFFRCRQHDSAEVITDAKKMASPPLKLTKGQNRMSPAGISMFYCAFDKKTACLETIDQKRTLENFISTAIFTNNAELNLLDFSKLPPVPSIFDKENRVNYYSIIFLKNFINDLSKDIERDGSEHIEYVPTQIVTEYFRFAYEEFTFNHIDGIIYPSSKSEGRNSCVLFFDYEESLKCLKLENLETVSIVIGT